jgi:hypothetical protein
VDVSDALRDWLESDQVLRRHAPVAQEEIQKLESEIGHPFPKPLRELLTSGGPEGFLGETYIAFFNASDITACWRQAQPVAAGFVPFASNGGGEWYGYDFRSPQCPFVLLPALAACWDDAMLLGATWNDFLGVLKAGNLFDRKYVQGSP